MSLDTASFNFVRDMVRRDAAIVLDDDKTYLVESRLRPLARQAGSEDVGDYVRSLRTRMTQQTRNEVVEAMTTNETSFFRDQEPFRALREKVFPDLIAARRNTLSVWSAACSSGQEAYSIAMSALECRTMNTYGVRIVGTDISAAMVAKATSGLYTQLEVSRGLPAQMLVKYFRRDGMGWRVNPEIRALSTFSTGNLLGNPPAPGVFDIIFLRNVLIYFDGPTKRQIVRRARQALRPDGALFLGTAEIPVDAAENWERISVGRTSYYRPRKELRR
ncbi:MAG: chemotaxis protein CheR [Micrococcales bacterium]|nr:MAG: chemotaxis protein CheR [Micrococcales bacterium]PIE26565.1 MAG: chemotaxis protein CheR [Micrococcales bacterium]